MKTLEKTRCVVVKCSKMHQEEKKMPSEQELSLTHFFLFFKKRQKTLFMTLKLMKAAVIFL